MIRHVTTMSLALALFACAPQHEQAEVGTLSLALDAHAGGVDYRLTDARFALEGPDAQMFDASGEGTLSLELAPGSYTLTLLEGYTLTRLDDGGAGSPVNAKLVSENPAPVEIKQGETTLFTLRFELEGGVTLPMGDGTLAVTLEVLPPQADPGCVPKLRINEVDYEQAGSDDGEFVEVLNAGDCDASLAGVLLELVNGGDGKVYGTYALSEAAPLLFAGQRLVLGDAALLEALALTGPVLPLRASGLQNGPDGLRIVTADQTLDALHYGGAVPLAGEAEPAAEDKGE